MSIRAKTKQRLLILASGFFVFVAGVTALGLWQMQLREARMQEHRERGMQAIEAEDYATVIEHLSRYHRRNRDDLDAAYALAVARRNVQHPDGGHLRAAMDLYRSILEQDPQHAPAQRDLLEIYSLIQRDVEAVELADRLLDRDPEDVDAMHYKIVSLTRLRRNEEALDVAENAVSLDPTRLRSHELALQVLRRLDRPDDTIIAWARDHHEQHPDDPRLQTALGYAHTLVGDHETAARWLNEAAAQELDDPTLILRLVHLLAGTGRFDDARALLERSMPRVEDERLTRVMARFHWERSRYNELQTLLADLEPESPAVHSELIALKAASHLRAGDRERASQLIAALKEREGDNTAAAWAPVLEHILAADEEDAQKVIDICEQAVEMAPNIAYIRIYLAEALSRIGETELAIDEWRTAARLARTWATPHIRLAQTLDATGRSRDAISHAHAALRRAPTSLTAHVTLTEVLASLLEDDEATDRDVEVLLTLLEQIQQSAPGQQQTLPTYVTVLARTGRPDEAAQVINDALEGDTPLSEQTLIRLAEISRRHELAVTEQLLAAAADTHGPTANLAYARAISRHAEGDTDEALAYLRDQIEAHGGERIAWRLVYARFLDVIGHDDAPDTWRQLARDHPDNINLQRTVLTVRSIQDDRELLDEVIERVRELSGEQGLTWRMARARWLLNADETAAAREAVELLEEVVRSSPNLAEPRQLLADAKRRAGDEDGAIEQLTLLTSMQPDNLDVVLDLARLRMRRGDYEQVNRMVNRVVSAPHAAPRQRRDAAQLLAQLGQTERAVTLLGQDTEADGDTGLSGQLESDLLRAELHMRRGRMDQAEQIYRALLDHRPGARVIQAYANLLGARGRDEEAREVLAVAERIDLADSVAAMLQAEYARRYGSGESAVQLYREAVAADPTNDSIWRRLIDLHIERGEIDEALSASAEAHDAVPGSEVFALFVAEDELLRLASPHQQLRPVVRAMLHEDAHRDTALQALRILHEADEQGRTFADAAGRVRRVADGSPHFLAVQMLAVDLYLIAEEHDAALLVAERAMQNFPNRPEPAQRATRVLVNEGNWRRALRFANDWRDREMYRPLQADIAIAEAHLNLDDPRAAIEQIDPYLEQARQQPEGAFSVINVFTRALAATGETDRAAELLEPLLDQAPAWRHLWIALAMQVIDDDGLAARWLERVQPFIPEQNAREWTALAANWHRLGQRAEEPDYRRRALAILDAAATGPADGDANLLVTYAILAYQEGDRDTAEDQYRRALQVDAGQPIALNNLAMLLADRDADLDEALTLAQRAVEVGPASTGGAANYYDTLAYVQMQRGDHADAIVNLHEAIRIEPEGIHWRINLVEAYHRDGDREQARAVLDELEAMNPNIESLDPAVRARYEQLRDELGETQAAAP